MLLFTVNNWNKIFLYTYLSKTENSCSRSFKVYEYNGKIEVVGSNIALN